MKVEFDANQIFDQIQQEVINETNEYLIEIREKLNENTPELTLMLIENNEIEPATTQWFNIKWAVSNSISYAEDVEEWMWVIYNYHKYPEWWAGIGDREIIHRWDWIHMFEKTLEYFEKEDDIFNSIFNNQWEV